jgi:hypothetical protein
MPNITSDESSPHDIISDEYLRRTISSMQRIIQITSSELDMSDSNACIGDIAITMIRAFQQTNEI